MNELNTKCQFLMDNGDGEYYCLSSIIGGERCRGCIVFEKNNIKTNDNMRTLCNLYSDVFTKARELDDALAALSKAASDMLGYEVVAVLCNGEEIEFRKVDGDGVADAFDTLLYGDISETYNKNHNRNGHN